MKSNELSTFLKEIEHAAKQDAYGRLDVLVTLVTWTTRSPIRNQTLQVFIDMLARNTGVK